MENRKTGNAIFLEAFPVRCLLLIIDEAVVFHMVLLGMYHLRNRHPPNLPPRPENGSSRGRKHHQKNQPQGSKGYFPGCPPACRHQILVQQAVKGKTQNASQDTTGAGVGAGLRRKHPGELSAAHTNGPHGSVLTHPCRGAHGNAVYNVKAGNQHDHSEKAI